MYGERQKAVLSKYFSTLSLKVNAIFDQKRPTLFFSPVRKGEKGTKLSHYHHDGGGWRQRPLWQRREPSAASAATAAIISRGRR